MSNRMRAGVAAFLMVAAVGVAAQEFTKGTYVAHPPDDPTSTIAVTYGDAGKLVARFNGEVIFEGKYVAKGNRLDYLDQTGPAACQPGEHGAYTWKLEGKRMTFTLISDKCQGRMDALTNGTWTLQ